MSYKGSSFFPILPEAGQSNTNLHNQGLMQIPGYDIECEIGCGGMATVYRAVQQSLGRRIAIKVLSRELSQDLEFVDRFKREGQILAQLSHPHIITIYDIGVSQDNRLFLSIEYLSGGTLKDRIKQDLSIESTLKIIKAVAKALNFAHQKGVIHRDIKPANILFRHDGTPILTDFGVARTAEAKTVYTATGFIVGSPGYMSPEQAKGEGATTQSDLYGLGVVLYEMLVGHPPYPADNSLSILFRHLNDPIPELPQEYTCLQPVLNKLLAKEAAERYESADDFLEALDLININQINTASAAYPDPGDDNQIVNIQSPSSSSEELTGEKHPHANIPSPLSPVEQGNEQLCQTRKKSHLLIRVAIISIVILAVAGYRLYSTKKAVAPPENSIKKSIISTQPSADATAQSITDLNAKKIEWERQQLNLQAQQLFIQAQSSFQENSLHVSLAHVEKGLLAVPNHPELLALREQIKIQIAEQQRQAEERERQEKEVQRQAEIARRQKEEQVRQQAEAAKMRQQADHYLTQALANQRKGRYTTSLQYIEKGLDLLPKHEGLLSLKTQVRDALDKQQQKAASHRVAKKPELNERQKTPIISNGEKHNDDLKKLQDIRKAIDELNKSLD